MTSISTNRPRKRSLWAEIGAFLERLGEAIDITEADLLAARIERVERELAALKDKYR